MNSSVAKAAHSPQPAAPLQQFLEDALQDARFAARIDTAGDESALNVTLLSSKTPFDRTVEAADAWLARAGIEATAALNTGYDIVLTLRTQASVHQLITVLLDPHIRAHTTATQLADLLESHCLFSDVTVHDTHTIEIVLPDDNLRAAVGFAALLGSPGIDGGLALHRPRGMRRLAERIQWLLSGVVASTVRVTAVPGCAHAADQLTIRMSIDQTRRLAQRLARETPQPRPDLTVA
ncbi:hypothetical protein ACIF8T_35645 [Streptomyces sp. NPDC085946]|uniref:hypothetical protein n=1 Tax=Streptomyces sp. NPDC085946 TaxID=3365744 RepID=UPI0037D54EE9